MGRKKDPTKSKVIRGTFRKDREVAAVCPSNLELTPPNWLPAAVLPHFEELKKKLTAIGCNSHTFSETVAQAALRTNEIIQCNASIEKYGMSFLVESVSGEYLRENPAVGQRDRAMKHLNTLLGNLCLSPATLEKAPQKQSNTPPTKFSEL